jgi:predicted ATP-grasp superfamily ATP-dependent carboligase
MEKSGRKIAYVTRAIERALGMKPGPEYLLVSNNTPYGEMIKGLFPEFVTLIDPPGQESLSTNQLLEHAVVRALINSTEATLLAFKNTARIELIAQANGWTLLNPKAALSEQVENKISQIEWLGNLATKYLPEYHIQECKNIQWEDKPLVVQWAHGHTGNSTVRVSSEKELRVLQQEQSPREVTRASKYIYGPSFTVNAIVAADKILVGNISYQITGTAPFTCNEFTTVGNDWSAAHRFLSEAEVEQIVTMARAIGTKLSVSDWRGLYGIDVIRDAERGRLYLIEINARQPASTTFESFLQGANRCWNSGGLTTFEAHLKALRGESIENELIPINEGAQIIQRVTNDIKHIPVGAIRSLELAGYRTISYPNTSENIDLLRIQSAYGLMEAHGKFNERGMEIKTTLDISTTVC